MHSWTHGVHIRFVLPVWQDPSVYMPVKVILSTQVIKTIYEFWAGISKLVDWVRDAASRGEAIPLACQQYLECIAFVNEPGKMEFYPGSPTLFQMHCRETGRSFLMTEIQLFRWSSTHED